MGVYFIEFPKLGIHLNISPVAFSIGSISVYWYGIIIAGAIMIALSLALKETKKFGYTEDDIIDMFLIALPVSIIFARLFFVVFTWESYKNDFLGIFKIWKGGLAIYGAVIGAVLSVFIYTRRKKMNMLDLLDFACVYLPLAQAIGRWGNFTNQELYGKNTDLPWGMTGNIIQTFPAQGVDGTKLVHPTFLYESILNLIVFAMLLRLRKNRKVKGTVFSSYLMLYSFVRFLMEFLRTDEFGAGDIRYNQVFALLVFVGALFWFIYLNRRKAVQPQENPESGTAFGNPENIEEERSGESEETEVINDPAPAEAKEVSEPSEAGAIKTEEPHPEPSDQSSNEERSIDE